MRSAWVARSMYAVFATVTLLFLIFVFLAPTGSAVPPGSATQGMLLTIPSRGEFASECPLHHTDVKAEISGFIARVTVTQEFENTAPDKIEAVYVFPLPPMAAVDEMTMYVGDRVVKGTIKRREEARQIYETARARGQVAGLLDQERPNIFTQSVANIAPNAKVKIMISYVDRMKYEAGTYEFRFPMVVGPRYMPGTPVGKSGGGWAPDTDQVPDASRISPPVAVPGTRAGHDISVHVALDAGVPVEKLSSPTHDVSIAENGVTRATVDLRDKNSIPNKDFILRYQVAGQKIQDAVLTHRNGKTGYFSVILQPPDRVASEEVAPKELVFVLDTSGSMRGFPIEKAKEAMRYGLEGLNPNDTFNLITFSGDTHILFPKPVPATHENIAQAKRFIEEKYGSGGTEMMRAIRAALAPSDDQNHIRVTCFMTDGYVGNDEEIIEEVRRHPNARVFAFGIGSAVNHFLLDKMSEAGRGEVEYVGLKDDGSAAARKFYERVRNPVLTDIAVDWGGMPVAEVYPSRVPDLFSAKPIVLTGEYTHAGKGVIHIRGNAAGRPYRRDVTVDFPEVNKQHDVLATLWARTKIDHLMMDGGNSADEITRLGLDYKIMTEYTSFVAVEEKTITEGGAPRKVQVPVEMPEGVSYEGVFGERNLAYDLPAAPAQGAVMNFGGLMAKSKLARMETTRSVDRAAVMSGPASPVTVQPEGRADSSRMPGPYGGNVPIGPPASPKLEAALTGDSLQKYVVNGKVHVTVTVVNASAAVLNELRKSGLDIATESSGNVIVGWIRADRLKALSELGVVTHIGPYVN